MQLKEWVDAYQGTVSEAAKLIGVTRESLYRLMQGGRYPRPATVDAIVRVTCGQVTLDDIATACREFRARQTPAAPPHG